MTEPKKTNILNSDEESRSSRLWRKSKESPFMPLGLLGLLAACGYGAYNFKNKGGMSTSVYLMHQRVTAQGILVGALTIGVGISFIQSLVKKMSSDDSK